MFPNTVVAASTMPLSLKPRISLTMIHNQHNAWNVRISYLKSVSETYSNLNFWKTVNSCITNTEIWWKRVSRCVSVFFLWRCMKYHYQTCFQKRNVRFSITVASHKCVVIMMYRRLQATMDETLKTPVMCCSVSSSIAQINGYDLSYVDVYVLAFVWLSWTAGVIFFSRHREAAIAIDVCWFGPCAQLQCTVLCPPALLTGENPTMKTVMYASPGQPSYHQYLCLRASEKENSCKWGKYIKHK